MNRKQESISNVLLRGLAFTQKLLYFGVSRLERIEALVRKRISDDQPNEVRQDSSVPHHERVCHFHELYITHDGDVFPCCIVWNRPDMKIGHLEDDDLFEAIEAFDRNCQCEMFTLRKGSPDDPKTYLLNIELSLACQGNCAMCCVEAPQWTGKYNYYDACARLIERLQPQEILVQGGEILVQKRSLEWLETLKRRYPNLVISLVTNGNVDLHMVDTVERIFKRVAISIVGFQPETYTCIMGMNMTKTLAFAEALATRKQVELTLKYLITPLNIHEANLFLSWAIALQPHLIWFDDAGTLLHINQQAPFGFWEKIFERTGQAIRNTLSAASITLREQSTRIQFTNAVLIVLTLDKDFEQFVSEHQLTATINRRLIG